MAKIFVSYRRKDSPYAARLIREALVSRFGRYDVFFDVENIQSSQQWKHRIAYELEDCQALVVVIGKRWRKLFLDSRPDDMVRFEIQTAVSRRAHIYLVLVDDATERSLKFPDEWEFLHRIQRARVRAGEDCGKDLAALTSLISDTISCEVNLQFARVGPGQFRLGEGSRLHYEQPALDVEITRPFKISKWPLTIREHEIIMGPRDLRSEYPQDPSDDPGPYPTHNVSWYDAIRVCNVLSTKSGVPEYYRVVGKEVSIPDRFGRGFRLPTEAEWELACRQAFQGVDLTDERMLSRHAVFGKEETAGPQPVSSVIEDRSGSFCLLGNVWEWCWDWWSETSYQRLAQQIGAGTAKDPCCEFGPSFDRVVRGGCYRDHATLMRPWSRQQWSAAQGDPSIGIRIAQFCDC